MGTGHSCWVYRRKAFEEHLMWKVPCLLQIRSNPNAILHLSLGDLKNPPLPFHRSPKKAETVKLIHCPSQTRLLMDMVR
jgi:hypothetical protein